MEMQENMKRNNIPITGIPEGEEEEQGIENLSEKIMMENSPNLMREKVTQIQESQRVPSKRNPKRPTARYIIIKMEKLQDKENLKGSKGKKGSNITGSPNKVSNSLLNGNAPSQKRMANIFQVMRTRGLQPRLLYPTRLSIKIEGKIRSCPDKRSLKEYNSTKPALQEMLKGLL